MILKTATDRSADIAELERLARIHPSCAKKAQTEIANIRKGQSGEGTAAHYLDREFRDSTKTAVLHDIRLECSDGDFAQIDHLVINRVQGAAWILETKNYSGNLHCNEHHEWTLYYGRKPVPIASPVAQAQRQVVAFERWLRTHEITGINKVVPVVLVNPRSAINRKHLRPGENVIKSDNFRQWLDDQSQAIGFGGALMILGRFAISGMDEMKLRDLGKKICKANRPASFDWRARMGLSSAVTKPQKVPVLPRKRKLASVYYSIPEAIPTPHGEITIRDIGGDYAVRNPAHPDVIEIVKGACKGKGKWNARYRNWIVSKDQIASIAADISKKAAAL